MQNELINERPELAINLLGVNKSTESSGNSIINDNNRSIPWLQDRPDVNAWSSWEVTRRDVIILDPHNQIVAVFNCTAKNLSDTDNYNELKAILIDLAEDN